MGGNIIHRGLLFLGHVVYDTYTAGQKESRCAVFGNGENVVMLLKSKSE